MNYFSFNPFGNKSLTVSFDCDSCGMKVKSEDIFIPAPNYAADKASDSQVEEEGFAICDCGKEFPISIYVTYAGGDGHVDNLNKGANIEVEEISDYELEAILSNTDFYDNFEDEILKIKELNDFNITTEEDSKIERDFFISAYGVILPDELIYTLRNLLYINVITCLETYLSSAYINTVISTPDHLKRFYENYKDFQKERIPMSQLYDLKDKVEDKAKEAMYKVVYHNLDKVKPMYKDTLNIEFPNFAKIARAIEIRHDIVHRNGKTKEGEYITISKDDIGDLISEVEDFVNEIERQIKEM
ncbi:HEPN domain-containing protein [Chryseobacterium geocarposphaerae]|uniref:RiboL-PSP-HEPN domain-containing protein n=1 Tax=Chryseobacterium geocarposphaerae TaxID=1416776 RepID=A0A2M9C928_9FLAO|nr:HEPN domain-containing protein [Chryseobacterium geocarposphaerae]PJJ67335.1 hypothetical protein CLV73_1341 [Chryseobacterium geocarposphaerae]